MEFVQQRIRFDEDFYLDKNPDVRNSINTQFSCGLEHWLIHGKNEGRQSQFHEVSYPYTILYEHSPKISVVMSTYARNKPGTNCHNQLKRAVDSILNQTFRDLELVIVDDASFDGTQQVLESYKNLDKRVKIFRFEDNCKGFTPKRYNFAISKSHGDYIAYMCDDDEWFPDALETLVSNIGDATMVYGMVNRVYQDKEDLLGETWSDKIYSETIVPPNGVLIKKELFHKYNFIDESEDFIKVSDQELWCRFRFFGEKLNFVPRSVGRLYYHNEDSISKVFTIKRNRPFMNLILRYECFDETGYLNRYPEIAELIKTKQCHSGLGHYIQTGYEQGRIMK